jgi:hypothetical protein
VSAPLGNVETALAVLGGQGKPSPKDS